MTVVKDPKTEGLSPKVIAQAVVAVVSWVLTYFAIDLSPELASALAVLFGGLAGVLASPGKIVAAPRNR